MTRSGRPPSRRQFAASLRARLRPAGGSLAPSTQTSRATDLNGRCNVCGLETVFRNPNPGNPRESLVCTHCGTISRYRSLAQGMLRFLSEATGIEAPSLSDLPLEADGVSIRVYDTQIAFEYGPSSYPIPDLLDRLDWIQVETSVYRSEEPWGASIGPGCTNQSLEKLTYADDSFDIVVSSDVLEHVRLAEHAHKEIARVLKPSGVHLFTVPHIRSQQESIVRVLVRDPDDPSLDEHLMPPEYHGDPNQPDDRALVYRVYGRDLDDALAELGFAVDYTSADLPEIGIVGAELFYCRLQ